MIAHRERTEHSYRLPGPNLIDSGDGLTGAFQEKNWCVDICMKHVKKSFQPFLVLVVDKHYFVM